MNTSFDNHILRKIYETMIKILLVSNIPQQFAPENTV